MQNHRSELVKMINTASCAAKQLIMVVFAIFAISSTGSAQTFPSSTNCSSKELDLLETILRGSTENSLAPGNRKFSMTVANKGTSDKRAYVLWAKMNRYDINGVLKESRNVAFGVDSVKKGTTMTLTSKDSLYFGTDDMIELTNIYTAWSAKSTEDITYLMNNTSKIAPNCAVKNPIRVYTGVNARFFTEKAACANGKGLIKTRPFGGKAPYTVSVSQSGSTSQTTTTVTNDLDSTLASLPPGIYRVTVVDGKYNSSVFTREVLAPDGITKPSFSVTHPNCNLAKGQIKVNNFNNGTKYELTQNGSVRFTTSSADLTDVDPGDYRIVATLGICSNADSTKVNNRPLVPNKPNFELGHPSCDKPRGWIKVNNPQTEVSYQLTQSSNAVATDAVGNFIEVNEGNYVIVARGASCNTNSDGMTINPRPQVPNKPDPAVTDPTCTVGKGQIKVKNSESNVTYALYQGTTAISTSSTGDFADLEPGDYRVQANGKFCNNNSDTLKVKNRPFKPAEPKFTVDHPTCTRAKGIITVTEFETGATYALDVNGTEISGTNGVFAELEPGTYQVLAKGNSCNTGKGTQVNQGPATPHDIQATFEQSNLTNCYRGAKIEITSWRDDKPKNYTYALVSSNDTIYAQEGFFYDVKKGTYDLYAILGQCFKSSGISVGDPAPHLEDIDENDVEFTQPSFCSDGTIKIKNGKYTGHSVMYSIFDTEWSESNNFEGVRSNIKNNFNPQVKQKNENDADRSICPAKWIGTVPCSASTVAPEVATASNKTISAEQTIKKENTYLGSANLDASIDVKTIPNPFSSKVRFVISAEDAGFGTLDIFNMQGQKVKTVYQGYINKGTNFFDLTMPASSRNAQLVYELRVGSTKLSGKLLQTAR
jgi:hypothetical protein